MYKVLNYMCTDESCEYFEAIVERTIHKSKVNQQTCDCGSLLKIVPAATKSWVVSKERTNGQLRERSKDHFAHCRKAGIHPDDTGGGSFDSDPVWRNKTRAKNTSRTTIDQLANAHKKW